MIPYLAAHFKICLALLPVFLLLAKGEWGSNRFLLALLYLILIKSVLPWGILDLSAVSLGPWTYDYGMPADFASGMDIPGHPSACAPLARGSLVLIIWAVGATVSLLAFCLGLLALKAKVEASDPCKDPVICELLNGEFQAGPIAAVRVSSAITTPFVFWRGGWQILLPKSFLTLKRRDKRAILAHEITHIRRHDFIKFCLLGGMKPLFFFSPLVRLVINAIIFREETETDLAAMRDFGITPEAFGQTILQTMKISDTPHLPVPTLIFSTQRRLTMRLTRLFQTKRTKNFQRFRASLLIGALAILALNTAEATGKSEGFIKPVTPVKITMEFGKFTHPVTKKPYQHNGIDLAALKGTKVVSPARGRVAMVDYNDIQGHVLVLQHDNGITTRYAHLSEIGVAEGDSVMQGQTIASVGNSGLSTGPHLHFEIHRDQTAVDPETLIRFR